MSDDVPQVYNQDYRHFDTLIWQVPNWASAIFALAIAVSGNLEKIHGILQIEPHIALGVFLSAVFFVLVLFANVLIRFRLHQGALVQSKGQKVPRWPWQPSGHASLLLIICVEASALLWLALLAWGVPTLICTVIALALLVLFIPVERGTIRTIQALQDRRALPERSHS